MAIIKNNLSMMMRGKVGSFSYYVADTRQIVRQAQNNSNYGATATRTTKQQERRITWANLVNFYSANKAWMKKAYENLKPGVSVYNRFIQLNINYNKVALTKSEAQAKIWVVASYRVTQGSLPSIMTAAGGANFTGIGPDADNPLTAGAFASALINANIGYQKGDAIVFVRFNGTTSAPSSSSLKTASYKYEEFVLDPASTSALPSFIDFNTPNDEYVLVEESLDSADAYVFIHTRSVGGQLLVSTEDMYVRNESDDAWKGAAQQGSAIDSYGQGDFIPLVPGGASTSGTGNDSSSGGTEEDDDDDGNLGA